MSQDDEKSGSDEERAMATDPIHGMPAKESHDSSAPGRDDEATMPSDEPEQLATEEAGKVVKICKACMVSQKDGGNYCVSCGGTLVSIRSVQDSCIGDVVGGRYTIVEKIGSGGMGEVYLGLNEPLDQQVAIKFLNKKFTSDEKIVLRFLNEARSYCKVNHPNAVTLLEYGQHDDGSLYLITEFIDGQGLTEVVQESGPLSTEIIVSVGVQVCEVLSAAHNQGIIHRDLKPDNLMMIPGSRGRYAAKVLDFGIAKIADDDRAGPMTETGSVFGTPEFMSPEQARGESAEPRSDIYAFGVILYFMATGKLPFRGKNKFAILNQQLNDEPVPPSELSAGADIDPELEAIILRCLSKSPDERPESADEVAEALEAIDWRGRATARSTEEKKHSPAVLAESTARAGAVEESEPSMDDGPAAEGDAAPSLGMDTFDDESDEPLKMTFDDDIDPMASTIGGELDDELSVEENEGLRRKLDTDEPSKEQIYRVDSTLGKPVRLRSAAIGLVVTVAVVGGVILWTAQEDDPPTPDEFSSQTVLDSVWESRTTAVLTAADEMVASGDIAAADGTLSRLDTATLGEDQRIHYDTIVSRASRASNTEMQLRSAVASRACDRAERLLEQLGEVSPGAAQERRQLVAGCGSDDVAGRGVDEPTPEVAEPTEQPAESTESVEPTPRDPVVESPPSSEEPEVEEVPQQPEPGGADHARGSAEDPEPADDPEPAEEAPEPADEEQDDPGEEDEDDVALPPREI